MGQYELYYIVTHLPSKVKPRVSQWHRALTAVGDRGPARLAEQRPRLLLTGTGGWRRRSAIIMNGYGTP